MIYRFIDDKGTFTVANPHKVSCLYFPLTNRSGSLLSSISPRLSGDIKKDNEHFLTPPASIEEIKHNYLCRRDFFLKILGKKNEMIRLSQSSESDLEAGILYHKLFKKYRGLNAEITSFIPYDLDVEVMWIKIKNTRASSLEFVPTSFIPLYGRSEQNLRDHRHVTSLLNRIYLKKYGIVLKPTMSFNERGHGINHTNYFVLGYNYKGAAIAPLGQFPTLSSFCGEEGNVVLPETVAKNLPPLRKKNPRMDGKESCAAFRFAREKLNKNQEADYVLIMGITNNAGDIQRVFAKLNSPAKICAYLEKTKQYWQKTSSHLVFDFHDRDRNGWLKWVIFQPLLRKLFGCSFLPHFDYGKGGRGWRDLWQDALHLIFIEPAATRNLIIKSLRGVRVDGSNATIITKDNDFIADRNRISRVWMDHGIWPYLTLKEYIHNSGDINILLEETTYFRDHLLKRAKEHDESFNQKGFCLKTNRNKIYRGSLLEHILIQSLVQFFNVGEHNLIKLEDGDWNDGLDMAPQKGESAAFSSMYAYNLHSLSGILDHLSLKKESIYVLSELTLLLDTLSAPLDYNNYRKKQARLQAYLEKTRKSVSGRKKRVKIGDVIKDLNKKSSWLKNHIRKNEWLRQGFFNGYYDNLAMAVEGRKTGKIRMILASQVFPIFSGTSSDNQTKKIWQAINTYLKDKTVGGFRLNTDFDKTYTALGRAFAFSYGDKENGAFFNHMVILLSYALYKRAFSPQGQKVLSSIYHMATSKRAKIYPMIPEYFNAEGRGLYFYLTGSASWYTYTLLTQVLGVKGRFGDLIIDAKLNDNDFVKRRVELLFTFAGRQFHIVYLRPKENGQYKISYALLEKKKIAACGGRIVIERQEIEKLPKNTRHKITVFLS
ncbi:MAG: cellobiose phosphorylase [Candidatus Omnitrophota bacterium]